MRDAAVLLALVCACSGARDSPTAESAPSALAPAETSAADDLALTIASYNINAGMSGNVSTHEAIRALEADVIVLQEVTLEWWAALKDDHRQTHGHRDVQIDKRHHYGGLAVLSRFPIREAELLRGGPGPFQAWRGVLETPHGDVQVVNVHLFPPVVWFRERGVFKAYQDSQARHAEELAAHLRSLRDDLPTIIAGDFNESINGDAMRWLIDRGFAPSHAGNEATWRWKVRGTFEVEFQLDHIMTRGFDAVTASVIQAGASDHRPILARLRRSAAGDESKGVDRGHSREETP